MYKAGRYILCDRCRTILAHKFNFSENEPTWVNLMSKKRLKDPFRGRRLDFCDEKCKLYFLKGRAYYRRKMAHIEANKV